jgi:epoxyqueuosine reductase QueG
VRAMDACCGCEACLDACPTGAILRDRFLIDNTRCLTFLNEVGKEYDGFPKWVPPSVHHVAYGCSRCLEACPANRAYIGRAGIQVTFTEEETDLLLQGLAPEELPSELHAKVDTLHGRRTPRHAFRRSHGDGYAREERTARLPDGPRSLGRINTPRVCCADCALSVLSLYLAPCPLCAIMASRGLPLW